MMDEKKKNEARKSGVTERGIMLIEECENFMEDNKDLIETKEEGIKDEKQYERAQEVIKKIEWYGKEIEIERKKSLEPIEVEKRKLKVEKRRIEEAFEAKEEFKGKNIAG